MFKGLFRDWLAVVYAISYLVIGSIAARLIPYYLGTPHISIVAGLLGLYTLLFATERTISRRLPGYIHAYFAVQAVIMLALLLAIPSYEGPQDYFAALVMPVCIQTMWHLDEKIGSRWVAVFAISAAASMIIYYQKYEGSWEGVGYGIVYVAVCILIAVFSIATQRAEKARRETQALLAELQAAHRKLEIYAEQVEKLAAAEERNRLARELHDSVSQTIFSMTLTAQAARMLLERDPARVSAQLDHLQYLSQNALAEMRSLIQQLRPKLAEKGGLVEALRAHAVGCLARDGLKVNIEVNGERRLPEFIEGELFRVVQEALNNVAKHSGVKEASVLLDFRADTLTICVEDHGAGFEPRWAQSPSGHLGLASMAERVRSLGGDLKIDSHIGQGTRIRVENVPVKEGRNE